MSLNKIASLLIILAISSAATALPVTKPNVGIFGGNSATPGQFPFIVALNSRLFGREFCGGAIINTQWIVTAAECVNIMPIEDIVVLAGTNRLTEGGVAFNMSQIFIHPMFNETTLLHNIAMVKIDGEFAFSELIQPITVDDVTINETCTVAGWGSTEQTNIPNELQFTQVRALSEEECAKLAEDGMFDIAEGPGQVCAYDRTHSPCFGDYGGPLIAHSKLVGLVSYFITPCAQGWPDVYIRISYYEEWMKLVMWLNS